MEKHNKNDDNTKLKRGWIKENRVLAAVIILGLIVVTGFLLSWVFSEKQSKKPNTPSPGAVEQNQDRTAIITQRVTGVNGVKGAQVIVLNKVALIALEVPSGVSAAEEKKIKNGAASTANDVSGVDQVLVTANPDLFAELEKILEGKVPLERLDYIYERIRDQKM